jgi:hypothetical protein
LTRDGRQRIPWTGDQSLAPATLPVSVDAGPSIHGKRIALLREMFPAVSKLICIAARVQWEALSGAAMRAAAEAAGIPLVSLLIELPASRTAYRDAITRPHAIARMRSWCWIARMRWRTAP